MSVSDSEDVAEPKEYWFNTKTGEVETGKQVAALYRIGPFGSFDEAKNALKLLADRAAEWRNEESEDR